MSLNVIDTQVRTGEAFTTATAQENINKIYDLVLQDRCVTIKRIIENSGLLYQIVHST